MGSEYCRDINDSSDYCRGITSHSDFCRGLSDTLDYCRDAKNVVLAWLPDNSTNTTNLFFNTEAYSV